jgi:hypothetical protein
VRSIQERKFSQVSNLLTSLNVRLVAFSEGMSRKRLRLVIFSAAPGLWIVRGLEHDLGAEARTIGEAVRAAMRFVQAHTAFDIRHDHLPLEAFPASPRKYWNAFAAGTAVPLSQLGITSPDEWDIQLSCASGGLAESRSRQMSARTHASSQGAPLEC